MASLIKGLRFSRSSLIRGNPFLFSSYSSLSCSRSCSVFLHGIRKRMNNNDVEYRRRLFKSSLFGDAMARKQYGAAISIFKDMWFVGAPVAENELTSAINCYRYLKRTDLGFAILGSFFKRGFLPITDTYRMLIRGLFLEDRSTEAVELFEKLVAMDEIDEPRDFMVLSVIDQLCVLGHTLEATELLGELEKAGYEKSSAYVMILESICCVDMVDEALQLFFQMIDKDIFPEDITYSWLFRLLCDLGRWREAKLLLNWGCKIFPNPFASTILVNSSRDQEKGVVRKAKRVAQIMTEKRNQPANLVIYNALLDKYCVRGEMMEASKVLNTMMVAGCEPDIQTYNILLNGYFKEGWQGVDKAFQLFQSIPVKDCSPILLPTIQ